MKAFPSLNEYSFVGRDNQVLSYCADCSHLAPGYSVAFAKNRGIERNPRDMISAEGPERPVTLFEEMHDRPGVLASKYLPLGVGFKCCEVNSICIGRGCDSTVSQ